MEYTVQKLAKLAGISARTLRYYDEIGILKPERINSSGYRIYGKKQVERLQQILLYRALEVDLTCIRNMIEAPSFDGVEALKDHRTKLMDKRKQLDLLIENVEKTIANSEGRMEMSDKERFEGFKKELLAENERKYGEEIRNKYGEESIQRSNKKLQNMTEEEYEHITKLEQEIRIQLHEAMKTADPTSEQAQKAAQLHREWISFYWDSYSGEAHAGVAQMYVDDERFRAYYDKDEPGTAAFLRDAIVVYTRK